MAMKETPPPARVSADELAVWVEAARDLAHSRQYRYQTAGTPGSRDDATYQSGKAHAFDDVLRKIREGF